MALLNKVAKRILAERSKLMKPRSLRSLGPVKSSTFLLLKEESDMEEVKMFIHYLNVNLLEDSNSLCKPATLSYMGDT